ncbi:glycosyltransferase family 4 protein [Geobacter sp. SVR]|uniref:glycosyltransferase family 4 protein n=1 Tax=Geobacter sp. SVR TaxID=2495594 RepID=UPI00143EF594|nr:glycosyltransferase family 4 protein [Geobacter sp. SVR]BCS54961.1 glycosyl transferase [Geobacter sp. SVR]GCF86160.1 glycosyl transferase group 1 [Geobacter sp. SVR]
MKVLKIIHTQGHGGAENAFRWLAWGLCREGVDVLAAIPEPDATRRTSWIASALDEAGVPYLTFDKRGTPVRLLQNIASVVGRVRPDVVHSHLLDSNFYASLVSRRMGIPHVSTEHGDLLFIRSATAGIKYSAISFCSSRVICVSEAVRNKAAGIVRAGKLATIPNGINFFRPASSCFREHCGIPSTAVLIGNVGNLYPIKGQKFLIEAFAQLLASHPDARLVLVGRGAEEPNLRHLARELNIEGKILFTGFRNDVEDIVNSLDLYVQPSLSEGHPLAVLEAMSIGIPVITSAVGGLPELLDYGRYGALVPPASSEELHARMLGFMREPEPYRERAHAAQCHVREQFSIEKMTRRYIEVYEKALAGRQHRCRRS